MQSSVVLETQLDGLTLSRRGKVRDVYDLGSHLLIVATDRISAFDYILGSGIPDKGKVLTQLSAFWFDHVGDLIPHQVVLSICLYALRRLLQRGGADIGKIVVPSL